MPQQSAMSLTGCKAIAVLEKAALVNATVHLFKAGFHPSPANVVADYAANECDFDNYAAVTIAAWGDIVLASGNAGYAIQGVLCEFLWAHVADDVQNGVGGWWVQTAAGVLRNYFEFSDSVPMQGPDQSCSFVPVVPILAGQIVA